VDQRNGSSLTLVHSPPHRAPLTELESVMLGAIGPNVRPESVLRRITMCRMWSEAAPVGKPSPNASTVSAPAGPAPRTTSSAGMR